MSEAASDDLYHVLAGAYEEIFPTDKRRVDFCRDLISTYSQSPAGLDLFDIGCGTGELCRRLAADGYRCAGLDLDALMIERARLSADREASQWSPHATCEFYEADMLSTAVVAANYKATLITCFGNSLVHLNSDEEVGNFLDQARGASTVDGSVVLQILNYDRIMRDRPTTLPPIESEGLVFSRSYEYHTGDRDSTITFRGTLSERISGKRWTGETQIRPVFRCDLESMLSRRFRHVTCTEDYAGTPASSESTALLFAAHDSLL